MIFPDISHIRYSMVLVLLKDQVIAKINTEGQVKEMDNRKYKGKWRK
jgi:hypothetical protein